MLATSLTAAHLQRVRLPWRLDAAQVLAALEPESLPFALVGAWAGGGAIVGSEPVRVADGTEDPFALLDELPRVEGHRPAIGGGWFGWLGYRLAEQVEQIPLVEARPVALPEFHLAYYDNVLYQDRDGVWWFEALVTPDRREALDERIAHLWDQLADVGEGEPVCRPGPLMLARAVADDHLRAVAECRERIAAGEIFQANICLRMDGRYHGTATELMRVALGHGTVPRYTAAFDTPQGGIVSLSPELFLRRQGRQVLTGPIKGTAVRPADPVLAAAALEALRESGKDAAEHVMIVDLMRNDIGRVCEYGSVMAPRHPMAEAHPGLWHLVSGVEGRLRAGVGDRELLQATFPPGSVTGAPKVQSLIVIAELEPTGREVYTGAVGYASPIAGLELNVAIRTLELADGRLWLGVGGGIVADSDPGLELEETLIKARPVAAAVGTNVIVE